MPNMFSATQGSDTKTRRYPASAHALITRQFQRPPGTETSSTKAPSLSSSNFLEASSSCASSASEQNVRNLCDHPCDWIECPAFCKACNSSQPRNFAAVPISPGVTKYVAQIPCLARSGAAFRYCERSPSSKVIWTGSLGPPPFANESNNTTCSANEPEVTQYA